jgi:O-antigen ligase/tetratricopeptide (TPR) repeat protein
VKNQLLAALDADTYTAINSRGAAIPHQLALLLLRLVDLGLMGTIFVAPLAMGGRHEIGRLIYVAIACFTAVCWVLRHCFQAEARWRWSGAEWLVLAGLLLILLQIAPLPNGWLTTICPELGRILPLWTPHGSGQNPLGIWNTLTLTPGATRGGCVLLMAHAMLFFVVVQRIGDRADVERLVRWIGLAAIVMAVLGVTQFLFSNGKFLWFYEHPSRTTEDVVKGSFQNQNHLAHFLALGIGPLMWWLFRMASPASDARGSRSPRRGSWSKTPDRSRSLDRQQREIALFALTLGAGIVVLAGLWTFSRGGLIAIGVSLTICLYFAQRSGLVGRRARWATAGIAVLLAAALAIHGHRPLMERLSSLGEARSLSELCRGRQSLWSAHLEAIPRFALCGTGVGSHAEIYRTYMREHVDLEFTHGESGYLHVLLETGFVGLTLALSAAALACYWCWGATRTVEKPADRLLAAALLAGLAASLVHSVVDFVWYIPACMSLTVVMAACACRLFQMARGVRDTNGTVRSRGSNAAVFDPSCSPGEMRLAPLVRLMLAVVVIGASFLMLSNRLPPARAAAAWDAYLRLALADHEAAGADEGAAADRTSAMLRHLRQVLDSDPWHARANLRLAMLLLREFDRRQQHSETPMPLVQIRDAALASRFAARETQDRWLSRVMGANRQYLDGALWHARQAVRLCPLQGEGYVYLAELAFLDGAPPAGKHAYVEQALHVRPYSGTVLLEAGAEAALAGDQQRALDLYRRAFHQAPEQRRQIIRLVAARVTAEDFVSEFQPDGQALDELYTFYRAADRLEDARFAGQILAVELRRSATQESTTPARAWERLAEVHHFLGDTQAAIECLRNALFHTPDDYRRHRWLASLLASAGQLDAAVTELQWCLSRRPQDAALRDELEAARRRHLVERVTAETY